MKRLVLIILVFILVSCEGNNKEVKVIDSIKVKEDLNEILTDLSENYAYLNDKNVDLDCLRESYESKIDSLKSREDLILFFEYLLDEFYDSHLILNTNTNSSFRLFSPIYATFDGEKYFISNIWQTQISNLKDNILGAEIIKINEVDFDKEVYDFPTFCNDKNDEFVKEWIANKILSGRYNQKRILTLKTVTGKITEFNLDEIKLKKDEGLLSIKQIDEFGYIRINNSLGENKVVKQFDDALDNLMETKGLILDLRNTVDGGNSFEARGIMGRFINEKQAYQEHSLIEKSNNNIAVERSWVEYVSPRRKTYDKPLIVLVGRWTGSMAEGIAIGLDGMERAEVIGSEMERLGGEVNGFSFKNQAFGYRIPTAKLFHVNGIPREKFVPNKYIKQTSIESDEILEKGLQLLKSKVNK